MKKNNKCKLCGGTGNIRYEIEYDCTAVKPCPTCCQPEAKTEQTDFPKLTKQQKKDQTEFIETAHKAKIFEPEQSQTTCLCHPQPCKIDHRKQIDEAWEKADKEKYPDCSSCQPEAQPEQKNNEICCDPRCVQSTECNCDNPMRCDCVIGCRCEYICNHCRKVVNKWHNCRKDPQPTDGLSKWEKEFAKFYTFRFEYISFDGKRRFEVASVNDPMSKSAAIEMVKKHVTEFNGRITDFVECEEFKNTVHQLLAEQRDKTIDKIIRMLESSPNGIAVEDLQSLKLKKNE